MAAVGTERISSVVGYALTAGNFSNNTPNLPQRVAVLCEANTANQATLDVSEWQATSLKAVGARYGYGSPAYLIARIALPVIGGIPLVFYPQPQAAGATAKIIEVLPTGTANANATHTIIVGGRTGLDAQFYNFTVVTGDTADDIASKMADAVNGVLGSPVLASDSNYSTIFTSKWKGATANDIQITVDNGGASAGITYSYQNIANGAGTPSIAAALSLMEPVWNTIGINSYGTNTTIATALEAWNGIPDPENPTGRYIGTIMKPMIWLTGSVANDPSSFTDPRKAEVTLSISPGPQSAGLPMEAAANHAAIWSVIAQNTPELDILNKYYPDMPTPIDIGDMADYNERDRIVKLGCSTVNLINGKYQFKDPVTTFHPDGELQPAFRWCRDLMIDFNIRFRYKILEDTYVVGKVIANDADTLDPTTKAIKPKTWKQILLTSLIADLVSQGLIADPDFVANSLVVGIDETNPNRFNTAFNYKKTGVARISATKVESGVNLGTFSV